MKDLNFFGHYQGKKKEKVNTQIYIYAAMGIVGLFIVSTLILNSVKLYILEKSIEEYTLKLQSTEIQADLKEAEDTNKQIDILSEYNNALNDISESVYKRNNVSDELLNNISSTIPSEILFKDLEVTNNTLTIKGTATNRTSIAELQHNLSKLSNIQNVYVGSIGNNEAVQGEYSFDIKCILKDVELL